MIEKIIYDYMTANLGVKSYMEKPAALPAATQTYPKPQRYIVIEKTGQSATNHLNRSIIAVQCYAESLYQAAVLSEMQVRKL